MKYQIIYADPPWDYNFKSPTASPRPPTSQRAGGASYYYPTMPTVQIKQLYVQPLCEDDCMLYLWATNPMMPDAFAVMRAWGFEYKTMITWHKLRCKGMGYWFRGHTEHLLFGVKGNIKPFRSLQHNIVEHEVLEHSKKPGVFREIIEKASPEMTRRVELFARERYNGWDVWGNEVESDIDLAAK